MMNAGRADAIAQATGHVLAAADAAPAVPKALARSRWPAVSTFAQK